MLRDDIEARRRDNEAFERGRAHLMEALRGRKLTAWGKEDKRRGGPDPS